MRREIVTTRPDWQRRFDEIGFSFHSLDGLYWNEGVCYRFDEDEIDHLEEVTADLHQLCLEAVERVIDRNLFARLGIPEAWGAFATESWKRGDPSLYGRFDFSYGGVGEPKLLEYNADTPTSLVESSIAQWIWLEELFPEADQFNSIHEKLQDAFTALLPSLGPGQPFYFTCVQDHREDLVTVEYLRDVAVQIGLDGRHILIEDIGFDGTSGRFCDLDGILIDVLFKLYPWEWLLAEEFGAEVLRGGLRLFEPPWKLILSSKAILPILWEIAPGHKNLLPASFDPRDIAGDMVKKPLFSREGANVVLTTGGRIFNGTDAGYGAEGHVFQQAHPLPNFDGNHAVIGSWIANGLPAGIGIREDATPITTDASRFVPHFFK